MKIFESIGTRLVFVLVLLVPSAILSILITNREFHSKVVINDRTLPERIGNWVGESIPLTETEKSMLDSPAACQRVYKNPSTGELVQVLVLQVNNTQNAHDPKLCMAGSGYDLNGEKVIACPWKARSASFPVSLAEFVKGSSNVSMYYWLQTPEGSIANMSSGFKLEGIKKALMGSTVKGVSVRVIALPRDRMQSTPTDSQVAVELWQRISNQIGFDRIVAKM